MRIDNKKTADRFILLGIAVLAVYAFFWISNIFSGKMPAAGILLQGIIILVLGGLLAMLFWLKKEAEHDDKY